MNLLLRKAKIIDVNSAFHNKIVDVEISNGVFSAIGENLALKNDFQELNLDNLHISKGWFDSSVCLGEPGFEDRETIINGLNVAAKSGFTKIALQPNTFPIVDNQSQINFVQSKANGFATKIHPIGALTKNSEGKDLAELYDMKNAGAIAFGDYNKNIDNPNLLKIALQYVQDFDGLVIAFSQESNIKGNGVVNEGIVATRLGLKGIPALAEELQIAQNIFVLEYTGGKLHIPTVSTAKSAQLIREAKAKGLQVTCSVSVHHLVLTDEKLETFDTRFKVSPPLRTNNDRLALIEAVKDGTIDMITSDHNPMDIEHKKMEFDLAKNGTIGLESAFGALLTVLPLEIIIDKLTSANKLFLHAEEVLKVNSKANITLFTTEGNSVFSAENILSKSKNSAFLGTEMKGKVYGIYNNQQLVLS
ncbi:dihydroorotase [Flavobacterium sp.]|uniref:dihydroorotase n=1 Tax=Flavobacterium sp. TaxID=239 RepID=UPI00261F0722|nr:dihydroorotase [Flavobacterium sp.]MDD3004156.1 dihydroorotase [Flavobacterium sp.]